MPLARPGKAALVAGLIGLCVVAAAFAIAPRACEGGFEIYVVCGLVAFGVLLALPFVLPSGDSVPGRVAWGLTFAFCGIAAWFTGLFVANVQILCRLF